MVTSRADLVANQRGDRPRNRTMASRMTASVHSLVDATRKPNENVDAVIRHYKARLTTSLRPNSPSRSLSATLGELIEHCWQLVDAERKRWFK
jgi:hypothetical protein